MRFNSRQLAAAKRQVAEKVATEARRRASRIRIVWFMLGYVTAVVATIALAYQRPADIKAIGDNFPVSKIDLSFGK